MADKQATLVVKVSQGFADALKLYADTNKLSNSEAVRKVVADAIGYDMSQDAAIKKGKRSKYASPEERKAAQRKAQKARYELEKRVLDQLMKERRTKDMKALAKSVGIEVED